MFGFASTSQLPGLSKGQSTHLKERISRAPNCAATDLQSVTLDMLYADITILIDDLFAANFDLSSPLEIFTALYDAKHDCKRLHCGLWKSNSNMRSIFSSEIYSMVSDLSHSSFMNRTIEIFLDHRLKLNIYKDPSSLFDNLGTLNKKMKKPLLIEISMLQRCFENRKIYHHHHWDRSPQTRATSRRRPAASLIVQRSSSRLSDASPSPTRRMGCQYIRETTQRIPILLYICFSKTDNRTVSYWIYILQIVWIRMCFILHYLFSNMKGSENR